MSKDDLESALLTAKNYRVFLKKAFAIQKMRNPKFSYASFSKKAGFKSKSFPRDVSLGRRGLSLSSVASFSSALGLSADLKPVFELLVGQEEKSVRPHDWTDRQVATRLETLKSRILRKKGVSSHPKQNSFGAFKYWFEIHAALGSTEFGASLEQVVARTGIKKDLSESILKSMTAQGACAFEPEKNRYKPLSLNPIFEGLGKNPAFQAWFLHCIELARIEAPKKFSSDSALFLGSALSVQSHRLPELKTKLRDLLSQFIEDSENNEGDRVVHLVASLF